ncbi:hypothetical protein GTZ97_10905 [Aquabacterium fontiphilum]|uniref:pectin acetylesterase-family hydrolase n=1 Tax=Aquabacterium fontiphilum TaxID=450365 RepID=UPI00137697BD|nr:pectin acetylesterase-family hydrolase [Aquabacterium fontiphilum]NBD21173.1 hypothetical protein [Aquabacterium fontiphilum]
MSMLSRTLACALGLAVAAPGAALAVEYYKWTAVTLPASSGASCGNGTPARIFVNRTPLTTKTLVYFEGGGACWNQAGCTGQGKLTEVASNPNGVSEKYFSEANLAAFGQATPLITRIPLLGKIQTQSWNMVYVPYCTGDVHTGNSTQVYNDLDPAKPTVYYHRGYLNGKATAQWMADNLPRPEQLLVSGSSAGGVGSTANYGWLRLIVNPKKSALVADSGPLFPAPQAGTPDRYPSLPLQNRVRSLWGVDRPDGIATELITMYPDAGDVSDLSTLNTGLPKVFPNDRFGYMSFQEDGIFSAFSYTSFYPEIAALSGKEKDKALNVLWRKDLNNWVLQLRTASSNTGFYLPLWRPFLKSHTLVTMDFTGTGIEEQGIKSVVQFYDNVLDTSKPVMRAIEYDQQSDFKRVLAVNPLQWLVALFEGFFL